MKEFIAALVFVFLISLVAPDIAGTGTNDPPAKSVQPGKRIDLGRGVFMDFVRVTPDAEVKRSLTVFGEAPHQGSTVRIVSVVNCEATRQQIIVWRVPSIMAETVNVLIFNNGRFATEFKQNAIYKIEPDKETIIRFTKVSDK